MKAGLSFLYLRDENRFPVACVAIEVEDSLTAYKFATSTVNPLDRNKFSKILAKQIAVGRLDKKPICAEITTPQEDLTFGSLADEVVAFIARNAPGRITRNAAKNWIREHGPKPAPPQA